jgi:hypothetical protein
MVIQCLTFFIINYCFILIESYKLIIQNLKNKISRDSIDAVKNYFREDMTKSDWQLIIELKKQFQIL